MPRTRRDEGGASVTRCRFCSHTQLKLLEGSIDQASDYCALDLYSSDRTRVTHALRQLIKTPQNNLRISFDGVEVNNNATIDAWTH
jgi:hypothetical protein